MDVYLVTAGDYDEYRVLTVCTSFSAAHLVAEFYIRQHPGKWTVVTDNAPCYEANRETQDTVHVSRISPLDELAVVELITSERWDRGVV